MRINEIFLTEEFQITNIEGMKEKQTQKLPGSRHSSHTKQKTQGEKGKARRSLFIVPALWILKSACHSTFPTATLPFLLWA